MANGNKLDKLENLTKQLVSIIDLIRNRDVVRQKYGALISDKRLMAKYHKRWIALVLALALYRILAQKDGLQRFASERQGFIERIRPLDLELAKRIEFQIEVPSKEELAFLMIMADMLNKDQQAGISYIQTHYVDIMQQLKAYKDRRTAFELRRLIILISGSELKELNKCISEVSRWTTYRLAIRRIQELIDQLQLFVKGGFDTLSNETFLGLASHFKDAELMTKMFKDPRIKKLWTYKEEIEFFRWAEYVIRRSLREPGWEGFLGKNGFYYNLRKGKNYIAMVRDKFGNKDFADFLEGLHEKIHQAPELWERGLQALSYRLNDPTYQNTNVIVPAKEALTAIFTERINQLTAARTNAVAELQKLLNARVAELQNAKLTIQREFAKIARKKKEKLLAEWDKMKSEFEIEENKAILPSSIYLARCNKLFEEFRIGENLSLYDKLLDISQRWINFMKPYLMGNEANERNIFRILRLRTAATRLDDIEAREFNLISQISNPDDTTLFNLEIKISQGHKKILPKFQRLVNYVKSKLESDFVVRIEDLINLKLEDETEQMTATEEPFKKAA